MFKDIKVEYIGILKTNNRIVKLQFSRGLTDTELVNLIVAVKNFNKKDE